MTKIEKFKNHFQCDPDTGILTWKKRSAEKGPSTVGTRVGNTLNSNGYRTCSVLGSTDLCHRVIMMMHIGRELSKEEIIDHLNNDGGDNRLCNLRITTTIGNAQGARKKQGGTTSKYIGVSFRTDRPNSKKPWRAKIFENGKTWYKAAKTELDAAFYYNCEVLRRGWPAERLNVLERGVA